MTSPETAYVPGVCNINPREIAYRRNVGYGGIGLAILLFVGLLFTDLSAILRGVIVFVPLAIGVLGLLQAKNKFCVSYGGSGRQNAAVGSDQAKVVTDKDALAADRAKSRRINGQALPISVALAILSMLVPHI